MPTEIQGITFFTVMEVADILKVTSQTVRSYIKQGRIKAQRIGRPLLISEESLKVFLSGSNQMEP